MGLNVKLYNITNDGPYSIRYKSGPNPYPEHDNTSYTLYGTGLTNSSIVLTGMSFDTQYWVKMTDETTNRYIVKNIYTNDSKTYPCYDTLCFDTEVMCDISPTPTPTPPCCSQWTYYFSGYTPSVNIFYQTCENISATTSVFGYDGMIPQVFGCVYPGTTPYINDTQWGGVLTNTNQCC
jgi:hypothetical protein